MTEIDDNYNSAVETLDQDFLEKLNQGAEKTTTLKQYLKELDILRAKRETEYKNYITKSKKEIWNKKKKKEKPTTYKHLEVKPFQFEFTPYEKTKQYIEKTWFKFKRHILYTFWTITPKFLIHQYYATKNDIKDLKETITTYFSEIYENIKKQTIKLAIKTWTHIQNISTKIWKFLKEIGKKLAFWKKEKKEGEKKEETAKEETKEKPIEPEEAKPEEKPAEEKKEEATEPKKEEKTTETTP